jgi:DNA-binding response OmpR family regulator
VTDTVLVADDDDDILLLVMTRLKREGFEIVSARNGTDALELARRHAPRVAVLDVGMPGMDGLEVLAAIRADESLAKTRVLLLTAKAQESDVRRGFDTGADGYVKKPFSPAELARRVRELYDAEGAR